MTIVSTGQISILDIRNELGLTGQLGLGDTVCRDLAGIPTGPILISNFYGKSADVVITVTEGLYDAGKLYGYYYGFSLANSAHPLLPTNTAFGSRSATTFNGVSIEVLSYATGGTGLFVVSLQGNRAQSFFTSVIPQGGVELFSASADVVYEYDATKNQTFWGWSASFFTMPTDWNGSGTRTVTFTS